MDLRHPHYPDRRMFRLNAIALALEARRNVLMTRGSWHAYYLATREAAIDWK